MSDLLSVVRGLEAFKRVVHVLPTLLRVVDFEMMIVWRVEARARGYMYGTQHLSQFMKLRPLRLVNSNAVPRLSQEIFLRSC